MQWAIKYHKYLQNPCELTDPPQLVRHFTGLQSLLSTLQHAYQVIIHVRVRLKVRVRVQLKVRVRVRLEHTEVGFVFIL